MANVVQIRHPWSSVLVEKVDNGYSMISFIEDSDDSTHFTQCTVIEEKLLDNEPDFDAAARMLWELLDILGIYNSKHFKKRLDIVVKDIDHS